MIPDTDPQEGATCEIDFFFDFISPFAYLAFQKLPEIARRHGRSIRFRPMDLAAVRLAAGNTGPSNRDIPPKYRYLQQDLARWAELYGVPFQFPHAAVAPPGARNTAKLQHGVFFAARMGQEQDYIASVWRRAWGEGRFIGAPDVLEGALAELGFDHEQFQTYVASEEATIAYEAETEIAKSLGVFGAPTMICDGQMWWGNDRLDMLSRFLGLHPA